jgi:Transmembrane domain of unknown function (DUF3566)
VARRRRRIRRGIRVRRVVRRVELGSLFRLAVAFHLLCFAVSMAVLAIVANLVDRLGLLGRVEKFLQDAGFAKGFKVNLSILLRAAAGIGLGLFIVAVIATMLLGFFFNGVSGLLGGLVVTVLEERPPTPRLEPEVAPASVAVEPVWEEEPTMWDAPPPTAQWDRPNQSGPVAGTAV